jgi:hypothetical protein
MPLIESSWPLLCIVFGAMLILTLIMGMLTRYFYTLDVVEKKFSIMDLEIPATPIEMVNLIKGLYKLDPPKSRKAIRSLRAHLLIDFIFMPSAYGSIFILCMLVAAKMKTFGVDIFIVLAWLQIVPFVCDIIENIYILQKIKPEPELSTPKTHRLYLFMELVKWLLALLAAISAIAAICYYWLSHYYSPTTLNYGLIIIGEVVAFLIIAKVLSKKKKDEEIA